MVAISNEPDRRFHDKDVVFEEVLAEIDRQVPLPASLTMQRLIDQRELCNDEKRHQLCCKLQICRYESLVEASIISTLPPATEFELCKTCTSPIDKYEV